MMPHAKPVSAKWTRCHFKVELFETLRLVFAEFQLSRSKELGGSSTGRPTVAKDRLLSAG